MTFGIATMLHNPTVAHDSCCSCGKPFEGARNAVMCPQCRAGRPGRERKRKADAKAMQRRKERLGEGPK